MNATKFRLNCYSFWNFIFHFLLKFWGRKSTSKWKILIETWENSERNSARNTVCSVYWENNPWVKMCTYRWWSVVPTVRCHKRDCDQQSQQGHSETDQYKDLEPSGRVWPTAQKKLGKVCEVLDFCQDLSKSRSNRNPSRIQSVFVFFSVCWTEI